ncbi:MAG: hypothetical protein ACOYOV_05520 [Bacteroidales bacterium]
MLKPQVEGLDFALPVDEMLQLNAVMLSNFAGDKADFTAKVSDLKDPFLDQWQNNTDSLSSIESDSDYTDTQLLMTQDMNDLMVSARDQLQTIYFYVERAYPGNKAVISYFGKDQYEAARKLPQKLVDLLLKAKDASEKPEYKPNLEGKGATQALLDDLKNIADKLKAKTIEREVYMSGRKLTTQNRNKILNKIWESMSAVNEASKLIYKNDYAKQQQYLLYYPKPKITEDVNTNKLTV